jgi:hypothetical protein
MNTSVVKNTQSKKSPKRRKVAQSGHTAAAQTYPPLAISSAGKDIDWKICAGG